MEGHRYVRGSFSVSIVLVVFAVILLMPAIGRAQSVEGERQTWLVALQGEVTAASTDKIEVAAGSHGIAFTDRPERKVALVNLADFVKTLWGKDGEFVADPPNASLVDESKGLIAIVEITNADWREGTLRLEIAHLDGSLPAAGDYVAFTIDAYAGQTHGSTR